VPNRGLRSASVIRRPEELLQPLVDRGSPLLRCVRRPRLDAPFRRDERPVDLAGPVPEVSLELLE